MLLLEGVGDVLEEHQAEHDVLVLGGVHAAAQRVGHLPELRFVADGGGCVIRCGVEFFFIFGTCVTSLDYCAMASGRLSS